MGRLKARRLTLAYRTGAVVHDVSLAIPPGRVTAVVGANACGKSTLLRGLARLLAPAAGSVLLDGEVISRLATRDVAQRMGILPQAPTAPEGLTVADLVARGRHPYQSWWAQWSREDEAMVAWALEVTGMTALADRAVDELSGGQRQRGWIAMALAQGTPIMLLDEPTTYLDMAHQVEVLDLLATLNRTEGRTIVMVLHDLNQACRYADHLLAMKLGRLVFEGQPADVVTPAVVEEVFGLRCRIVPDPVTGTPLCLPEADGLRGRAILPAGLRETGTARRPPG